MEARARRSFSSRPIPPMPRAATLKVELAKRRILYVRRAVKFEKFPCHWQEQPEPSHGCDIIFGGVDKPSDTKPKLPTMSYGRFRRAAKGQKPLLRLSAGP
jgi:hypothetical protein